MAPHLGQSHISPAAMRPVRRGRRRRRNRVVRVLFLLVVCLLCALGVAIWMSLPAIRAGQDGLRQVHTLEAAVRSLHQIPSAADLHTIDAHCLRLSADLHIVEEAWQVGHGPLLFISQFQPHLHRQLAQVAPLLSYGAALSSAGHLLSAAVAPVSQVLQNRASVASGPVLVEDLAMARAPLLRAASLLADATTAREHITLAVLPSSLQTGLRSLDRKLPQAPPVLRAVAALPAALGADGPRDYLVIPQNTQDLRATGGYIGTVALVRIDGGHARLIDTKDAPAVDLNHQPNVSPPLPMQVYGFGSWFFRDANWSANFPTSARLLEIDYQLGVHQHVDGVIALNPPLLAPLLRLTGPVRVPGYHETLTDSNAFDRIDYQVNFLHHGDKAFAAAAYQATFESLINLRHLDLARVLSIVKSAVAARDLLLYANDPAVQQAIQLVGATGALNPTRSDYLYVVDTNMSTDKVNQLVQEQIAYHATIQSDRSILATVTLRHTNNADRQHHPRQYGLPLYTDFVRLFVPLGSTLRSTTGMFQRWPTVTVHNKTELAGYFVLAPHESSEITFHYRIPPNVDPGSLYTLLVQRQPGTAAIPVAMTIDAVPGIHLHGAPVRKTVRLTGDVTVSRPLAGGVPQLQHVVFAPEIPVVPGSHPEPWVTVPSGSVAYTIAAVKVNPLSVAFQTTIHVTGVRFAAGEQVHVNWNTGASITLITTTVTASKSGAFVTQLAAPSAPLGANYILAVGQTSGRSAMATVQVRPRRPH